MVLVLVASVSGLALLPTVHRRATCWKITVRRGSQPSLRFTSHDQPIEFDDGGGEETYGPAGGFDASAVQLASGLREQNLDLDGIIDSDHITHEDLRSGKYQGATVVSSLIDWRYPMAGAIYTRPYKVGRVKYTGELWTVELNGLTTKLQKKSGRLYTRPCNADLFDSRCGINVSGVTNGEVSTVRVLGGSQDSTEPRRIFQAINPDVPATSDDFYKYGEVRWNASNANGAAGHISIVKDYTDTGKHIELYEPTPFEIFDNDEFTLIVGCDKLFSTCRDKFSNDVNHRGFHLMPSSDKILKTPGTQG